MQNEASFTSNADTKSQHYFGNDAGYNRVALSLSPYSESRFVVKHQDLINRHAICLTRLREAAREVESLLEENATLRSVNRELNDQLSFMINASVQKSFSSSEYDTTPFEIVNRFQSMSCAGGGGSSGGGGEEFCEDESPTSVIETGSNDVERNWLPKSISVRSNGYLKLSQVGAPSKTRTATRPRISSSLNAAQKVYVRGGKKEEEPLELEVYNQGMFKTEICNKWQETGACPYGDHCQFAHGIEELRPVIRHPRYKTEVCRMILAGDMCPYGHRCHFRHALSEQEKLMGNLRPPTTLTLDR